jgi:hypothetical protein
MEVKRPFTSQGRPKLVLQGNPHLLPLKPAL